METELIGLGGVAGAGVVLAIVAMIRQTIPVPDRFTSALAVLIGIGLNIVLRTTTDAADTVEGLAAVPWTATVLTGILAGLAASGLWSTGQQFRNGPESPP